MGGDSDRALELGQRAQAIAIRLNDLGLQTWAYFTLGRSAQAVGDYRRGAQGLRRVAETLQNDRRYEWLIGAGLASVDSRARLAWCLAELGEFGEAMARAEEALRIAKEVNHSGNLVYAYRSLGFVSLRRGAIPQAIPPLEQAVELCRETQILSLFDVTAAHLGYAYALSGRLAEGMILMEEALANPEAAGTTFHPLLLAYLGESHLLAGRRDEAVAVAGRALDLAHRQKEWGNEAWVLRLLGDIAARADPPDSEAAAGYYARALARASELEMRPLIAHCHLGLAALHQGGGDHAKGQEHLRTAATLYRGMDMGSWLAKAETKLGSVVGTQL
jgi:tetratricopeptide (TPR) repeat protein